MPLSFIYLLQSEARVLSAIAWSGITPALTHNLSFTYGRTYNMLGNNTDRKY